MTDSLVDSERQDRVANTVARAASISAEALSRISTVREAVAKISAEASTLSSLVKAIDSNDRDSDATFLLKQAGRAAESGATVLESMNSWELQTLLEMSERRALKMKFISMMVKTDAATASRSSEQTAGFAGDLEELVGTVRTTTRSATKAAQPIPRKVQSATESLGSTADLLKRKANELARQQKTIEGLMEARDYDMANFNAEAQAISQASTQQIAQLIPILQFSDAFTQRLENTKRYLDDAVVRSAAELANSNLLGALQLESLAADNRRERLAASAAVNQLFEASMRSFQVMLSNKENDAVQRWVTAAAEGVDMTAQAIETSSNQLGDAFQRVDDAFEATANVTKTIREFDDLVHILHIEALNGAIAASHTDNTRSAAYVLAAEVRVAAGECAQILGDCMSELSRIEGTLSKLDRKGIEAEVKALTDALQKAKAMQAAQGQNMSDQKEARQRLAEALELVLDACRSANQTFHSSEVMEQAILELATALRAEGSDTIEAENVAWVWPYYTTQAERHLHTEIAGPVTPTTEDAADALFDEEDDDLEGFLI